MLAALRGSELRVARVCGAVRGFYRQRLGFDPEARTAGILGFRAGGAWRASDGSALGLGREAVKGAGEKGRGRLRVLSWCGGGAALGS